MYGSYLLFLVLFPAVGSAPHGIRQHTCPNASFHCPTHNTCCPHADGSYGCVTSEAGNGTAQCCLGASGLACPTGYQCTAYRTHATACVSPSGPLPDPVLSAEWPYPEGMAGWQLPYPTCQALTGPEPVFQMPLVGGLGFPYYSNVGALGSAGAAATAAGVRSADVEVALIVQHGANRNADDYFCSGLRAASLQTVVAASAVAVIAPRFMEPADAPPLHTAWWNGTFPAGCWRAGGETDPAASTTAATISSFAVLDQIVQALLWNRAAYPKLRLVILAGHSSGGQIVQRHALFTRLPAGPVSGVALRHVVANPSSFAYLDPRRWVEGALRPLTPAERAQCPMYDSWHFGIGDGLPPFCRGTGVRNATAAFPTRDVRYLQGNNDTCNEALVPGCHSHGLETTCMDMLQGRFRRERGLRYYRYLREFFGGPTHRLYLVPDVGHDHALIWERSLDEMFRN